MDWSWKKLVNLARKCGFCTSEGGRHTRVEDEDGKLITTIPRKNRINKNTAKEIIKDLRKAGCKI